MKKDGKVKPKFFERRIFAPFQVLKVEKIYLFWFVSFVLSFAGIIIDTFNGKILNSFLQGAFFSTGMAVLIPTCFEFLVEYQSLNRETKKEEYSTYKSWAIGLNLFALVLLFLFYITDLKSSIWIQSVSFFVILGLSFYTYLVTKMSRHSVLLEEYKTRPYIEMEKDALKKMTKDAKKLATVTNEEGGSFKV